MKDKWKVRLLILTTCTFINHNALKSLIFVGLILWDFTFNMFEKGTSFCGFTCMINEYINTAVHNSTRIKFVGEGNPRNTRKLNHHEM